MTERPSAPRRKHEWAEGRRHSRCVLCGLERKLVEGPDGTALLYWVRERWTERKPPCRAGNGAAFDVRHKRFCEHQDRRRVFVHLWVPWRGTAPGPVDALCRLCGATRPAIATQAGRCPGWVKISLRESAAS